MANAVALDSVFCGFVFHSDNAKNNSDVRTPNHAVSTANPVSQRLLTILNSDVNLHFLVHAEV